MLGLKPEEVVLIAEYCGGGFGSKGSAYPCMVIPAYMSKKIGKPVMMRISRAEEYYLGSARNAFQGNIKVGFDASGKLLAADVYVVQDSGAHISFWDYRAFGDALALVYQPNAMRWRGLPVFTNAPTRTAQRGPWPEPAGLHHGAAGGSRGARAQARPRRDPAEEQSGERLGRQPRSRRQTHRGAQRLPARRARQGQGEVQLGRTHETQRPEERPAGDRASASARRSILPVSRASTACCA
jgi:hypothetical protein